MVVDGILIYFEDGFIEWFNLSVECFFEWKGVEMIGCFIVLLILKIGDL